MKNDNSIPFSRTDLVAHLAEKLASPKEKDQFISFCRMIGVIYHHRFHEGLEAWKSSYAPLDPDRISGLIPGISPTAQAGSPKEVIEGIRKVLVSANYREITKGQLQEAFDRFSPWGLQLKVDLDEYEWLELYSRGEYPESSVKKTLFLRKRFDYSVFRQVVLVFKLKEGFHASKQEGKKGQGKYQSDRIYLKLFKNVPTVDLEMLFPDADIKIKLFDKLKVVIPLVIGAGSSLYKFISYILGKGSSPRLWSQIGFWALVGGLFGVALKGFFSYRNTIEKYLKSLTESLYFQNLDNNSGVFTYLMDNAEEEECKELLLGYFFLAFNASAISREDELDEAIEAYFREELKTDIDFEVDDSLRKLVELRLVTSKDGDLEAIALPLALEELERHWMSHTLGKEGLAAQPY